jgi:hypothetical protein
MERRWRGDQESNGGNLTHAQRGDGRGIENWVGGNPSGVWRGDGRGSKNQVKGNSTSTQRGNKQGRKAQRLHAKRKWTTEESSGVAHRKKTDEKRKFEKVTTNSIVII